MIAFAIRELNNRPSTDTPFQLRPSLMILPSMRKRFPVIDTTVFVSGILLSAHMHSIRRVYLARSEKDKLHNALLFDKETGAFGVAELRACLSLSDTRASR